jgi:predicted phage terminase large subunit-like protein
MLRSTELERGIFLRRLVGSFVPHQPTERQEYALRQLGTREILYGGAAGGGKSDWLLMEALRFCNIPNYSALILRRTFPELHQAGGLIPRSHEWLAPSAADFNTQRTEWIFPSGATLKFGHMQREHDKFQYQGGEYQYVGFDELTHFNESQYLYMFSRLRRLEDSQVPLRFRAASNPGGVGHDWVKQRWMVENESDRLFIPAKIADNPYLDAESYILGLMELSPYERAQLLEGNWDARPPGALFQRSWFAVVEHPPLKTTKRVRAWDLAATAAKPGADPDYSVGTLISSTQDKQCTVEDVVRARCSPGELDRLILAAAQRDGVSTEIWIEQEPGASGKIASEHFRKLLAGYTVRFERPTGPKQVRANPFASYAEGGGVSVVRGSWNRDWFNEFDMFGSGEEPHDDQVDSASLGFTKLHLQWRDSWSDLYPEPQPEEANV